MAASDGPESLRAIGILELLENDRRPTFVIDVDAEAAYSGAPLRPVFFNETLRRFPALQEVLCKDSARPSFQWPHGQNYAAFKRWACETYSASSHHYSPAIFKAMTWDATTVGHYNVISARLGARPYTSSFMETLLFTKPTRGDICFSETSSPSSASIMARHTPASGPSSAGLEEPISAHSRKVSTSYFTYQASSTMDNDVSTEYEGTPVESVPDTASPISVGSKHFPESGVSATQHMQTLEQLRLQREEIIKRTDLLDRISAIEAVAISVITADGELVYANEEWYRMCSFPKGVTSALAWMNVFVEEDLPKAYEVWERSMVNKLPSKFEARFKTIWRPPFHVDGEPDEGPTWISAAIYPDLSEDGEVIGGTGCIMDISEQKWLQRVQARKVDEAVERAALLEALNVQAAAARAKEREVEASEIRFRKLADLMPIGIFITGIDRLPIYANRKFNDMFALNPEAIPVVTPWGDAFSEEDLPVVEEFWRKVVEDHVTSVIETRMIRKGPDGVPDGHRWILCTGIPEFHSDGSLKHITGCIIDVTKIKDAEEVQRQRVKDVTEARKQQEAFIDMTSHEIRNPLSSIVHSADEITHCLSRLPATSDQQYSISKEALHSATEAAETILFCTQHSKRIIDDILTLSKLNSNLLPISLVPAEAKGTVEQAMKMFEGELRAADIPWTLHIDDSLDRLNIGWVNLDTSRILQILVNLIGNSIKFTQFEEKRDLRVSLSASEDRPSERESASVTYLSQLNKLQDASVKQDDDVFLEFIVKDTGCGIPADGQKMLFNRFTQDSTRTHVKYGGNGLGLFISRQLCELQGGQMGFRSSEGQGSTFAFFVKTARVSPPDAEMSVAMKSQSINTTQVINTTQFLQGETSPTKIDDAKTSAVTSPTPAAQDVHVLLVEDNLINQKVLTQQLRKRGYIVSIANHGQEALSHIETTCYWTQNQGSGVGLTVILMDIEMPVLNGLDCARRIRELEQEGLINSHIPIVAVTANARSQQVEDAMTAGMDDIISKPFRMPELVTLIDLISLNEDGET